MYDYFCGKVTSLNSDYLVLEVNQIGYRIFVPRTREFICDQEYKIYVVDITREEGTFLVGFSSTEERKLYNALIQVNGIGPKSAVKILNECDPKQLKEAIAANNILYLRNIRGIGNHSAAQILLDLRGFFDLNQNINVNQYDEVILALRGIGFKTKEITNVLSKINIPDATNEQILKEALRRIKENGQISRK